ncbi:uncharacterized protein LOC121057620 [Cygnus olor]|uniref:uncharacterized protein LOC121057620 n=1 Tax=Cygnus olor TaxID=8869 RepID=UPI001ADDEC7C|nr:uncharacterized protein LOC121057620 [Cygnus olor]
MLNCVRQLRGKWESLCPFRNRVNNAGLNPPKEPSWLLQLCAWIRAAPAAEDEAVTARVGAALPSSSLVVGPAQLDSASRCPAEPRPSPLASGRHRTVAARRPSHGGGGRCCGSPALLVAHRPGHTAGRHSSGRARRGRPVQETRGALPRAAAAPQKGSAARGSARRSARGATRRSVLLPRRPQPPGRLRRPPKGLGRREGTLAASPDREPRRSGSAAREECTSGALGDD